MAYAGGDLSLCSRRGLQLDLLQLETERDSLLIVFLLAESDSVRSFVCFIALEQ